MIKRTLEISREPVSLSIKLDQLVMKRDGQIAGSIPCEDVGVVVVDNAQTTYTHSALSRLMDLGAVVVICGPNHLPNGILIPTSTNTETVWRLNDQIDAPVPLRKRLWQQIVCAKIRAQAANLPQGHRARRRLLIMARDVRSGDIGAHEAQAAKTYWSAWLDRFPHDQNPIEPDVPRFRREYDGDGLNALLNYGYAILRAAIARSLVSSGLHPALGLQHSHRANPFCLADDLIEPLRPLVDRRARDLWRDDRCELDQPTKAVLLEVLAEEVFFDDRSGPLLVALHRYTASLVRCLRKEQKLLVIPVAKLADFPESLTPDTPHETE